MIYLDNRWVERWRWRKWRKRLSRVLNLLLSQVPSPYHRFTLLAHDYTRRVYQKRPELRIPFLAFLDFCHFILQPNEIHKIGLEDWRHISSYLADADAPAGLQDADVLALLRPVKVALAIVTPRARPDSLLLTIAKIDEWLQRQLLVVLDSVPAMEKAYIDLLLVACDHYASVLGPQEHLCRSREVIDRTLTDLRSSPSRLHHNIADALATKFMPQAPPYAPPLQQDVISTDKAVDPASDHTQHERPSQNAPSTYQSQVHDSLQGTGHHKAAAHELATAAHDPKVASDPSRAHEGGPRERQGGYVPVRVGPTLGALSRAPQRAYNRRDPGTKGILDSVKALFTGKRELPGEQRDFVERYDAALKRVFSQPGLAYARFVDTIQPVVLDFDKRNSERRNGCESFGSCYALHVFLFVRLFLKFYDRHTLTASKISGMWCSLCATSLAKLSTRSQIHTIPSFASSF
jgi:hypothetical protein